MSVHSGIEYEDADRKLDKHRRRHELLHLHLDELAADFIEQTESLPSMVSIVQLMKWSKEQTENPTERP